MVGGTAILRVSSAEVPGANSSATLTALEAAANALQLSPLWIHTTLLVLELKDCCQKGSIVCSQG